MIKQTAKVNSGENTHDKVCIDVLCSIKAMFLFSL